MTDWADEKAREWMDHGRQEIEVDGTTIATSPLCTTCRNEPFIWVALAALLREVAHRAGQDEANHYLPEEPTDD